jgi:outer membrane protein assembly factor BamB
MRRAFLGGMIYALFSIVLVAAVEAKELKDYDLLVTSASYGTGPVSNGVFRFNPVSGQLLGPFGCGAKIVDPRGIRLSPKGDHVIVNNGDDKLLIFDAKSGNYVGELPSIPGLNPGGSKFGRDGRLYVGSRSQRSVVAIDLSNPATPVTFIPGTYVKFPRGLAVGTAGEFYLASGTDPATGEGQNTILRFAENGKLDESFKVVDPELSPTDTEVAPSGNLLSGSEFPFKSPDAVTTVREYDKATGRLVRVFDAGFDADGQRVTRNPRGITIGPDGALCSVGRDNVVRYDMTTGKFDRVIVVSPGMNAQSLIFIPKMESVCGA